MKRKFWFSSMFLLIAATASAQIAAPTSDVLGAHLNYGRGCAACHSPHSGADGNGNAKTAEANDLSRILWGQDVSSLYGRTITTGGGSFVEVLPSSMSATTPDVEGMLTCLSCHDGNYASGAMMKNKLYESVPASYGNSNSVPTLLGSSGGGAGSYLSEHPAGLSAKMSCGGKGWDCSVSAGTVKMTGARSSQFVKNYGFFVTPSNYNNSPVVVCTTCHEPHVMNVVTIGSGSTSGLPAGNYATMFFLKAPYNPNDPNPASNQTAQFCRQCHGDKSNEMNGGLAGTVF